MGLFGKVEADVEITASASKFHEIFHQKPHHISNFSTDIHVVDLLEGEWGKVGSIIVWRYSHGLSFFRCLLSLHYSVGLFI